MRIGIIGNGVVGRATAFAWKDHCDEVRVHDRLKHKETHDLITTLESDLIFICIPEGDLDGQFSYGLPPRFKDANFVIKSTCPVGTTRKLAEKYGLTNVCHSPEFLTERAALWDACNPSRLLIGYPQERNTLEVHWLRRAYEERFPGVAVLDMTSDESEFVKLSCNSLYAAKVSLFNELRSFADAADMRWDRVLGGILSDGWTGNSHTKVPGPDGQRGFGGRCLPKDLDHLRAAFKQADLQSVIMDAVKFRNENIDRRLS